MADLVHLSNLASSEEIIDILNKDAGVIIDNLLHSDDISREPNLISKSMFIR